MGSQSTVEGVVSMDGGRGLGLTCGWEEQWTEMERPWGQDSVVRPRPAATCLAGLPASQDVPQGTMQTGPELEAFFLPVTAAFLGWCPRDS